MSKRHLALDGAEAKIARAREHLQALHTEIKAFIDSGAYGVVGYLNEQTGWKHLDFEIHQHPPVRWGVLVGDAAHNLRSALDHLVYELSGHKRSTQFPIFTSSNEYFKADCHGRTLRDRLLEGVPGTDRAIIDGYQPFQRVSQQSDDPLARLAWLNNADKHRVVHVAITLIGRLGDLDIEFPDEDVGEFEIVPLIEPPVEVKHGTQLYRVRLAPDPAAAMKVKSELPFRIAFGKGSRFIETGDLHQIANYVEAIVRRFA